MGKKNTRKYKHKNKGTKRKRGGKYRKETISYSLGRQHTNPDIRSRIRISVGPTENDYDNISEYMVNFLSDVAKKVEEEIAVIIKGVPESLTKKKIITLEFNDNDTPLVAGSEKPIKCKVKK
jgi:hypothetical protein